MQRPAGSSFQLPLDFQRHGSIKRVQALHFRQQIAVDQHGSQLIAEDVAKVDPNLAIRDGKGQIESVHYNAINAMLLNEFLKEHKKVEELKNDFQSTVAQQNKRIQALTAQLKQQAEQIEKVSAQIEISKSGSQVALK